MSTRRRRTPSEAGSDPFDYTETSIIPPPATALTVPSLLPQVSIS